LVNQEKRTQNEPKRTQNEPKSKKAKMNVTDALTKEYENKSNWAICENEPNTKPKQTQFHTILACFSSRPKMLRRLWIEGAGQT
jgi:hypothetical protein